MFCESVVRIAAFLIRVSFFFFLKEFEDLDEITARYIQPMASFARDLLGHKYFQECNGGSKEVHTVFCFKSSLFSLSLIAEVLTCVLFSSLVENGGSIDQVKEGEANIHSVLYFSV